MFPLCLPWQGKVYIDDVYSGGKQEDGDYPLLSTAIKGNLFHPNCRHTMSTYFEGISEIPEPMDKEELGKNYEKAQRENEINRNIQMYKRLKEGSIDPQNSMKYDGKIKEWKKKLQAMSTESESIKWPDAGVKISTDQYKDLMKYSREHDIELSGFKHFSGEIDLIKDVISDADIIAKDYPLVRNGKRKLTIELDYNLSPDDFAITYGHIIHINANAYRGKSKLAEVYQKLADEHWFVEGTTYRSIIKHELGHVVSNGYGINGMDIACDILNTKNKGEVLDFINDNLSQYSASYQDGSEIISEVFADVYEKENPSDFSLKFKKGCDIIVSKKG